MVTISASCRAGILFQLCSVLDMNVVTIIGYTSTLYENKLR